MKRRLLFITLMVAVLICALAISASAVSTTGNIDYNENATLADGHILPIYDADKNPLLWYISGTDESGANIYSSVVSTATKENPDANGYYVIYDGSTNTFTGPTGEVLKYHYSTSIYVKHITDTSVNFKGDDTMVVANMRGVELGDFQGGTIDKLQCFYAPVNMVRSGDFRNSSQLSVVDFTQSTNLRFLLNETFKGKNVEIRFPTIEPIYNEDGVLVNAFTIGTYAFQNCTYTQLSFPETLYEVQKNAFQNCKQLTTIGEAPNLTIIGNDAFENCFVLTGLDFASTSLTAIGDRAFRYAGLQDNIQFPSTLTSIGENAFYQAKLIKSIKLSENLEALGNSQVFRQITTLEYFDFNGFELETMGDYFFYKNSSLKAVSLPEGLKNFGNCPFEGCTSLEALYLPDSVTKLTYFQALNKLYFVNEPFSLEWTSGMFESESWNGQKPLKPEIYYMPSSLTGFEDSDLHSCKGINNTIVFPEGVTEVASQYTFYAIEGRNFVFLGNVVFLNVNSDSGSNYYFINNNVTAETLEAKLAGKGTHSLYFHSAGVHLAEKSVITAPSCVDNKKITDFCFCGADCGVTEVENSALGHEFDLEKGAAITNILYNDGFLNEGCKEINCARCNEKNYDTKVKAVFEFLGYATDKDGTRLVSGYITNVAEYNAYTEFNTLEFGVVAYIPDGEATTCTPIEAGENGVEIVDKDYTIHASLDVNCSAYDFILSGFGAEHTDLEVAMCAYVYDGKAVSYLCYGADGEFGEYDVAHTITISSEKVTPKEI